ncbi:hypothetical protein TSUD_339110 [Trifolium subterraneum]|nr:hypothetical protein TSUD_339110 [Trifolium subterraneum]
MKISIAQYEFFKLVAQWPPAACLSFGRCSALRKPQNFTLHGLWPSNTSTTVTQPRACFNNIHFTGAMVQTLFPRINISWPDLRLAQEERFWGAQWDNHGTCSQNNFNLLSYFKLALDIKDQVDILKAFGNKNIHPHPTNLYNKAAFEFAIKAITKKDPELRCIISRKVVYLFEVGLCLDPTGKNFMDCPTSNNVRVTNCKSNINQTIGLTIGLLPL